MSERISEMAPFRPETRPGWSRGSVDEGLDLLGAEPVGGAEDEGAGWAMTGALL